MFSSKSGKFFSFIIYYHYCYFNFLGGNGYIEDGREIFDDDLDEESIEKSKTVITGKKRSRDLGPISKKGNIRNMLAGMPAKKRKEVINRHFYLIVLVRISKIHINNLIIHLFIFCSLIIQKRESRK